MGGGVCAEGRARAGPECRHGELVVQVFGSFNAAASCSPSPPPSLSSPPSPGCRHGGPGHRVIQPTPPGDHPHLLPTSPPLPLLAAGMVVQVTGSFNAVSSTIYVVTIIVMQVAVNKVNVWGLG